MSLTATTTSPPGRSSLEQAVRDVIFAGTPRIQYLLPIHGKPRFHQNYTEAQTIDGRLQIIRHSGPITPGIETEADPAESLARFANAPSVVQRVGGSALTGALYAFRRLQELGNPAPVSLISEVRVWEELSHTLAATRINGLFLETDVAPQQLVLCSSGPPVCFRSAPASAMLHPGELLLIAQGLPSQPGAVVFQGMRSSALIQLLSDYAMDHGAAQYAVLDAQLPVDLQSNRMIPRAAATISDLSDFAALARQLDIRCPDGTALLNEYDLRVIADAMQTFVQRRRCRNLVVRVERHGSFLTGGAGSQVLHVRLRERWRQALAEAKAAAPAPIHLDASGKFAAAFILAHTRPRPTLRHPIVDVSQSDGNRLLHAVISASVALANSFSPNPSVDPSTFTVTDATAGPI